LWFEIIIIFKHETVNLQKIRTLSKIHSYSKMIICVCVCVCVWYIWTNVSIYHNKLQKQNSQIHSYEKKNLGKNAMQSFSKVLMVVHYISFAPFNHIMSNMTTKLVINLTIFSNVCNLSKINAMKWKLGVNHLCRFLLLAHLNVFTLRVQP